EIKYLIKYSITYILKTKFFLAFYIIYKAIIIERNIRGAFKRASFISLNLERIISKLNI
ncbi:uncharacterized protein NECHADRAFT_55098, partial [Fusarium vanettenii 77-13-4]